jgi:hypothetical protein
MSLIACGMSTTLYVRLMNSMIGAMQTCMASTVLSLPKRLRISMASRSRERRRR